MTEHIVSTGQVATLHNKNVANASEWARMLGAPQTTQCRAPSMTPFLASTTRIVRSFDVPWTIDNQGNFTVMVRPEAKNALLTSAGHTTLPDYSALHSGLLKPMGNSDIVGGYVTGSAFEVFKADDTVGVMKFVSSTAFTNPNNFPVLPLYLPAHPTVKFSILPKTPAGIGRYFIVVLDTVGGSIAVDLKVPVAGATYSGTLSTLAPTNYLTIQKVDDLGNLLTQNAVDALQVSIEYDSGHPYDPSKEGLFTSFSTPVSEIDNLGLNRCTACSVLVTNMAPSLVAGGELVMARTSLNNLVGQVGVATPTIIKSLPEERYWRSGNIIDGGYCWWIPSDLMGYEPRVLGETSINENVLVATGVLSQAGGMVRVIVTWMFEFYTSEQLFSRNYNCVYTEAHQDVWEALLKESACSANFGHMALLAGIVSTAKAVKDFYTQYQGVIDPAVAKGYSMLKGYLAEKDKEKRKAKQQQKKNKAEQKPKPKGQPVQQTKRPLPPLPPK